ncbi:MAG: hypothetical protein VX970_04050 [Planctomycetota bacterium]|nr:hypothetical protein [Planctomycetota bacterium]
MHIDRKQILALTIFLVGISGCQSGGSSSWKWWGAQKDQAVSPSELAGSPYDGVKLPSTQVTPPDVSGGKVTPQKKSLATVPPGTPTPNAYSVAGGSVAGGSPASAGGKPTYPSTSYPSTPYTHPRPNTASNPVGTVSAQVPSANERGASPVATTPRYPVTGYTAGNPQPRYPSTGFDASPVVGQPSAPPPSNPVLASSTSTYGATSQNSAQTGFNTGAPSMGPRYSANTGNSFAPTSQAVAPPTSGVFPGNASVGSPSGIGPRYANLPSSPSGSRYDAQPATSAVNTSPAQVVPIASPVSRNVAANPVAGQNQVDSAAQNRYPSVANGTPTATGSGPTRQVDFTPFQPGSTGRYVPGSDPAGVPSSSPTESSFQPGSPYNPPAEQRP